ncbi:hypothetical protein HPY86_05495 [candidate division WOR-3 bacterium]|nr:hypothetical protein [candidate division WOR-3 bacterium]
MARIAILLLALMLVGCGSKDPLASVKKGYPGASEYLVWKNYVLIRYPYDSTAGAQRALILQKVGNNWTHLAQSEQGFNSLREVVTYIPEMDESGVAAFKLR